MIFEYIPRTMNKTFGWVQKFLKKNVKGVKHLLLLFHKSLLTEVMNKTMIWITNKNIKYLVHKLKALLNKMKSRAKAFNPKNKELFKYIILDDRP